MTVSSRTPEGLPSHCPLCGAKTNLEFSGPADDAPCPSCGCLLWKSGQILDFTRTFLADSQGAPADEIGPETLLEELQVDSLDLVQLVMELEDEFKLTVPDEDYDQIRTVGDAVRYVAKQQPGDAQ